MTLASLTSRQQLTMAAAQLLLAARTEARPRYEAADAERLLHAHLRFSHRGHDARTVSPAAALDELLATKFAVGTIESWWLP
ncbi:hypothetical protein ACFQNE_02545 [Gordonia phosphorivorans]|uniref:Uncharacterized protein n=1 Tax=Gordonia phosphorivorans TaxID=1056982 RepID=A0ABV6H4E6_9ACTN